MEPAAPKTHIELRRGRPVIVGTKIKVSQVAQEFERMGWTPDEIVEAHPHLTLADVHAALAYFYDHQTTIRQEWLEAEKFVRDLQQVYPTRSGESR